MRTRTNLLALARQKGLEYALIGSAAGHRLHSVAVRSRRRGRGVRVERILARPRLDDQRGRSESELLQAAHDPVFNRARIAHATGRLTAIEEPRGDYADPVLAGAPIRHTFHYDVLGSLLEEILAANTMSPARTSYTRGPDGFALTTLDPLGRITKLLADENGNLVPTNNSIRIVKTVAILSAMFQHHLPLNGDAASTITRESENGRTCALQAMAKSRRGVARLRCAPLVAMVQTADLWNDHDRAER